MYVFDFWAQLSSLKLNPTDFEFPYFYPRIHVGGGEDPSVSGEI